GPGQLPLLLQRKNPLPRSARDVRNRGVAASHDPDRPALGGKRLPKRRQLVMRGKIVSATCFQGHETWPSDRGPLGRPSSTLPDTCRENSPQGRALHPPIVAREQPG